MKNTLDIIKIGGNIIDNKNALDDALHRFSEIRNPKILVHGGGKMASKLNHKLGLKTQMIHGRRITTEKDIEVVTMIYAGLINKNIVAKLQSFNCNAIGLSGCDMSSILAKKRQHPDIDFGYVGDIEFVNARGLNSLIIPGYSLVFSAITHDGKGRLLNTNADTIASKLAIAFSKTYQTRLLYCFEKDGVLADPGNEFSVIPEFNKAYFDELKSTGFINEGMIPKLDNCFDAMEHGVSDVYIGNTLIINKQAHTFTKLKL